MSDLLSSYEKLLGRQTTDKERQDLYRVKDALNMSDNDSIWEILMALQHYLYLYEAIPARIEAAALAAAGSSAAQAQSEISTAVAALVPTVESVVGKAATAAVDRAVNRIQWGRSVVTVWLAMITLGVAFGLGWLSGANVWWWLHTGTLSVNDFWHNTGWGIGVGIAAPVFLILGFHFRNEEYGWPAMVVAGLLVATMGGNLAYPYITYLTDKPAQPTETENHSPKDTKRTK